MESLIYKPFGIYCFWGYLLIGVSIVFCILSVFFILPAILMLGLGLFFLRAGRITVFIDDAGVHLQNEMTSPKRSIPWEELQAYQLRSDPSGHDILLLSPAPIPADAAKYLIERQYLSAKLWFDGVLVLPLSGKGNREAVRKFAYQMCIHK